MKTDQATKTETIPLTAIAARPAAGRAGLRAAMIVAAQLAMLAALFWAVASTVTAHAGELDRFHAIGDRQARLLAYAEPAPERFAEPFAYQRGLEAPEEVIGHPLNDAWMGLNVVTADGRIAGYVGDAFIGPDGIVEEIIITPASADVLAAPVYVPADEVAFDGMTVTVEATLAELSTYEPVTEDLAGMVH